MNTKRIFRARQKSPTEQARELALRDRMQQEKPSLEDLVKSGEVDAENVMTMGMYFDIQNALQALKHERERCGLSIGEVAKLSGLDRAVISRLENGKQDNPTVATLMRYAAAIGKRFVWSYDDLVTSARGRNGKSVRRTKQRK